MKTGSRKVRVWILMLLPGVTIAGSFVALGRLDLAAGIACGCVLWAASIGVLGVCTREMTTRGTSTRKVVFILVHVAKYALIALAVYAAIKHPQISLVGLAIGYTVGMAGYIAAQFADLGTHSESDGAAPIP